LKAPGFLSGAGGVFERRIFRCDGPIICLDRVAPNHLALERFNEPFGDQTPPRASTGVSGHVP
jgi:hypothetical protein